MGSPRETVFLKNDLRTTDISALQTCRSQPSEPSYDHLACIALVSMETLLYKRLPKRL